MALPADPLGIVGVVGATSGWVRGGDHTPGVRRRHLGSVGRLGHGIATAQVGGTNGTLQAVVDAELHLPRD